MDKPESVLVDRVTPVQLLASLSHVEGRFPQMIAERLEGAERIKRGAPEWEVRLLASSRWWKVHAELLRLAHAVYECESDEVWRVFERLTWHLCMNMPGEEGEKARSQKTNQSTA